MILRVTPPRPRNVTATDTERAALLAAAKPHLRLWLLLCSDMAIRSGTAATLGYANYNPHTETLEFRTKYGHSQRMRVTHEIATLVRQCTDPLKPWCAQLRPQGRATYSNLANDLAALKRSLGIARKLTPHDLRRTTARKLYAITHDLRDVQSLLGHANLTTTMWYLQDDLQTVQLPHLELAKLNPTTEAIQ